MKYFKVSIGYEDFISIDESEVEKAIYAQIVGNIVVTFKNGSIVGNRIAAITPDWHKTMGWNYAHKLGPEDWDELRSKGIEQRYTGIVGEAKNRVSHFIATGQEKLIGTGVEVKLIS